jgi:hypothetical protein
MPRFSVGAAPGSVPGKLQDGEGFTRHRLQHAALVLLPFEPSGGDIGHGDSHLRSGLDGHEALYVTDPVLCD